MRVSKSINGGQPKNLSRERIERTMLNIIAAMAASFTLCVVDEKLPAFVELQAAIRARGQFH
jgi:hypothetical protein